MRRTILVWVLPVVLAVGAVQSAGLDVLTVESGSMMPGIGIDDRVLVDKAAYGLTLPFAAWASAHAPRLTGPAVPSRGDIIAFRADDGTGHLLIKRVIGRPGDRVEIRGDSVWLNGRPLPQSPAHRGVALETLGRVRYRVLLGADNGSASLVVPRGELFVVGDNRAASVDSRHWGPIRLDRVVGRIRSV